LSDSKKLKSVLGVLTALLGLALAVAPFPAFAQAETPGPTTLTASTAPALISLILLVLGLVAVGLVALKTTGLPASGARPKTASVPDDDELIQDQ